MPAGRDADGVQVKGEVVTEARLGREVSKLERLLIDVCKGGGVRE